MKIKKILHIKSPKKFIYYCLVFTFLFCLNEFFKIIIGEKTENYSFLQGSRNKLLNLQKDTQKVNFIKAHSFSGEKVSFENFSSECLIENKGKLLKLNFIEKRNENDVVVSKVSLSAIFWHDNSIFNFIDFLSKFKPGFIKIVELKIFKTSEISFSNPVLKMELICEIYQKVSL